MPVPASIDELSPIAADNYPAGTEKVFPNLDDYLRFHASCLAQLRDRIEIEGTPLASVTWWGGARSAIALPRLPVDGQLLNRADHPELWSLVSAGGYPMVTEAAWQSTPGSRASFSSGDGSITFRMPDLNGKQLNSIGSVVLRGDGAFTDGAPGVIQDSENKAHTHGASTDQNGAHTHQVSGSTGIAGSHTHSTNVRSGGHASTWFEGAGNHSNGDFKQTAVAGDHSHSVSGTASAAGTHGHAVTVLSSGATEARGKSAVGCWVMRVK